MMPFVGLALRVCEKMEIFDKAGNQVVMRFCKMYEPEKVARIVEKAQTYIWWRSNPKAAFMKAVGEVNRQEKANTVT